MGIESPRVRWGIHPELLQYARADRPTRPGGSRRFFYPAGLSEQAQAGGEVLKAFRRFDSADAGW